MAETFTCPSCSAPLEYEGGAMQKCRFCGSSVIAPSCLYKLSDLLGGHENADATPHFEFGSLSEMAHQGMKLAEIQRLIQEGKKAEAVKLFHETFGGSLEKSTRAVEALGRGEAVDLSGIQIIGATTPGAAPKIVSKPASKLLLLIPVAIAAFLALSAYGLYDFFSSYFAKSRSVTARGESPAPKSPSKPESSNKDLLILKVGGEGNGAGRFDDNRTIAVDSAGNIYSGDYQGGRIQVFDATGTFKKQITLSSKSPLISLASDRFGNLFALSGPTIYKIDTATGDEKSKFTVPGATALTIGIDGKIYVGTFAKGIVVLSSEGKQISSVVPAKELELVRFSEIAVDGNGNIYVSNSMNDGIFKLSPTGVLLGRFGASVKVGSSEKQPPSALDGGAEGIALDPQGRVYVSQVGRISVYDGGGNYLYDFNAEQSFDLTFDDSGNLYVAMRPFVGKYSLNKPK